MAKDPAFLFYPNDWLGGTMGLTFEEKGCYIELLMMQFNKGKFTKAQAKHVLGICFDVAWANLEQKFRTDGTYFWNARLQMEQDKRIRFSESRRNNAKSPKKEEAYPNTSAEHMHKHMENENIIDYKVSICPEMVKIFKVSYPKYPANEDTDFPACLQIAYKIAATKEWTKESALNGKMPEVLKIWKFMVEFSMTDDWYSTRSISDFNKEFQRLVQKITNRKETLKEQPEAPIAPKLKRIN